MYRLDTRFPDASAPTPAFLDAALEQAARDASDVPGAYSQAPWGFRPATPEAVALLDQHLGPGRSWIVVTCTRSDAGEHTRERCLTAIQRYLLSLAAEGIDATWVASGLPRGLFEVSDVHIGETVLGVVYMDTV